MGCLLCKRYDSCEVISSLKKTSLNQEDFERLIERTAFIKKDCFLKAIEF